MRTLKTIGYVLSQFPVLSETFIGTEMRAIQAAGHRVVPLLLRPDRGVAQEIDRPLCQAAIHLRAAKALDALRLALGQPRGLARALGFVLQQKGLPRRSLLWSGIRLAANAKAAGCDHLHAHFADAAAAHAIVAAKLAGLTVSFVGHGHDVYCIAADLPLKLRQADFAVAVCNDMAADFHQLAPEALVKTVPCGVDPNRFRPAGQIGDNGRFLFIGRLVDQKGLDDAITALAQLPSENQLPLDIVGAGPLEPELRALANRLGVLDLLNFLGPRDAAWLAEHAPEYRALVAPFRTAADGSRDTGPVVVKEAMAMGLPVISTAYMGVKEMLTPACGWMIAPGDVLGLARAIEEATGLTSARRAAMGAAARARLLQRFTADASAKSLSRMVERAACA